MVAVSENTLTTSDQLDSALGTALEDGSAADWLAALADPLADPWSALLRSPLLGELMDRAGYRDIQEWLSNLDEWAERQYKDPRAEDDAWVRVLYSTWQHLKGSLIGLLTVAGANSELPARGGILCFVAQLELCLVVGFEFHRTAPSLTPLAVVEQPKAAFAVWGAVEDQLPARRDALRKMLVSGHKLIFHRGVLVHVDRRSDTTVFGPSIDTIVMAELLAEGVYRRKDDPTTLPQSVIEIGTGSGMLLAGALTALPSVERLVGVELDFGSVVCTHRNLVRASGGLDPIERGRVVLVGGTFDAARLDGGFDLAVCNPPYLPDLDSAPASLSGAEDYLRAVGGHTLIDQILGGLDGLLSATGRLLLMTNNMAITDIEARIPDGFLAQRAYGQDGRSVLLELEALYERPTKLKQLLEEGAIRENGDVHEHSLHPIWIMRGSI
jgi:methylase of polypeptide subunit release factors